MANWLYTLKIKDVALTRSDDHDDPLESFNNALAMLYDLGDRWHRVWIE